MPLVHRKLQAMQEGSVNFPNLDDIRKYRLYLLGRYHRLGRAFLLLGEFQQGLEIVLEKRVKLNSIILFKKKIISSK
jgi:hypothetical protein